MKSKIILSLSIFMLVVTLVACNNNEAASGLAAGKDLTSLGTKLLNTLDFEDEDLNALPEQIWHRHIQQVKQEDVQAFHILAGGGMVAEEVALFEAKDMNSANAIKQGMEERYEYLRTTYGNYSPEQLKNLEDPVLIQNGVYVFSVISSQDDEAENVINTWISEQSK